jgi:hypothetical protein
MNGRCETDPLDRAVDVCDRCYGEFCNDHLLRPKGRKHPLCSDCALTASGVRGSGKVTLRGERKTAKKRRKELHDAVTSDEQVFDFFDADPSTKIITTDHSDGANDDDDDDLIPIPDFEPVISAKGGKSTAAAAGGAGQSKADVDSEPKPKALESRPASGDQDSDEPPSTPAVARLEQLRREAEAQEHQAAAQITPKRTTPPATNLGAAPSPAPTAPLPNRQSTRPAAPPPERAPARAEAGSGETTTAAPTPGSERRRSVPPPAHRRPTAPMIGEVRNVAGRRADDSTETPTPAVTANDPEPLDPALNAVEVFDAGRDVQSAPNVPSATDPNTPQADPPALEPQRRRAVDDTDQDEDQEQEQDGGNSDAARADLDAHGNWIPPVLRGISPDAAEAKADLPQRPRQ